MAVEKLEKGKFYRIVEPDEGYEKDLNFDLYCNAVYEGYGFIGGRLPTGSDYFSPSEVFEIDKIGGKIIDGFLKKDYKNKKGKVKNEKSNS